MKTDPPITSTTHQLPLERLSPTEFERLCHWLVKREGYEKVEYLGESGSEQGRDLVAYKNGRRFAFQCKRVREFTPKAAEKEIEKLRSLEASEQPDELIFVTSCPVSANTRKRARKAWEAEDACSFWSGAELDERIKRHPHLLQEFFHLITPKDPDHSTTNHRELRDIPRAKFINDHIENLSNRLEEAYYLEEKTISAGGDPKAVRDQIVDLRRQLRAGGRINPGDFLLKGRFKILQEIGDGGFGSVWKAYDFRNRIIVAIKLLHGQFREDATQLARFFRGSRKMAELQHHGIVRIIEEKLEDEGFYFFVMEYLDGGDLYRATVEGRLSQEEKIKIIVEVGNTLSFAHGHHVIHRDVKPSNILLDANNRPKLADFDLVHAVDTTGGTRTGMLGTVIYAAPELMSQPSEAGFSADIYGLGMTAVFSLRGADLPLEIIRDASYIISQLDVDNYIRAGCKRAVAWDPKQRWASAEEFCRALTQPHDLTSSISSIDAAKRDTNIKYHSSTDYLTRRVKKIKVHKIVDGKDTEDNESSALEPRETVFRRHRGSRLRAARGRPLFRSIAMLTFLTTTILLIPYGEIFSLTTYTISIEGKGRVTHAWVHRSLRQYFRDNLLTLSLSSVNAALSSNPWIEGVGIYKKLPNELQLQVFEREAVALLRRGSLLYYVDKKGEIITSYDNSATDLLIINDTQWARNPVLAVDIYKSIDQFRPNWFTGTIELSALGDGEIKIVADSHIRFHPNRQISLISGSICQ